MGIDDSGAESDWGISLTSDTATPTGTVLDTFERAVDMPAGVWDALLTADDFYLSSPWLAVVEATARVPMRYVIARRAEAATAALATALLGTDAPWTLGRPDTLLDHSVAEELAGAAALRATLPDDLAGALLPSLVCGGRHLGRTRIGLSAAANRADLGTMVEEAERIAESRSARSISYLYLDGRDHLLRELLAAQGYLSHVSAGYCWLPLPAGGFDGYLKVLSAHRRRRVLAERRRLLLEGVDVRIEPFTPAVIARMAELETRLFAKYGMSSWRVEQSEEFLHQVHDLLGSRAVVSIARAGGEIRGFGLLLRFGDQWFAHRTGFDYGFQRKLPLYNEVLYHHPVEVAESMGIVAIHYGIGSTEAKLLRGCKSVPQYSYIRVLER
ncbi:GNAT family N-acetyltransferase [Actinocrispum wychmicini]|uniref:BioF2-like acetyltransferase domain-containing protein n=1 Tax=Actinocrispum wychmicini TaxID=1213861 RepID=A0A4R2JTE3_9PSEU|nr:GNAT family N-acetyltransferase [Actinocrispum wychmicini]TCO62904.1 hypothetical protein EV192_1021044 [Actinocrispum wychmicini]